LAGERRGQGLRGRLANLDAGHPNTAKAWACAAIDHARLKVCLACVHDRAAAVALEQQVISAAHGKVLWNVRRSPPTS
jgi:hypothetical protein